MSRIRLLENNEMEPDMAQLVDTMEELTGDSNVLRVLAHRPDILKPFMDFYAKLQMEGALSRKMVELIRLAVAQVNQCPNCLAARYQDSIDQGLTEDLVQRLPTVDHSEKFTEAEKAAITYGQKMAKNHHSVTDEDYARLHKYFSEKEVVEICVLVSQFIGVGRMIATIDPMNTQCEI